MAPPASGATLVELMIAIAIGLLLLTALAALFAYNSNARGEIDRTSQQIENGRYGLEVLRDDIHQAGFFAGYDGSAATKQATTACVPRAGVALSAANLGWQASPALVPLSIYGYAGGDLPGTETCITNQKTNTDVLVVRRVVSEPLPVTTMAAGTYPADYFMQVSTCADATVDAPTIPFVIATGASATPFTLHAKNCIALATVRKLVVRAYYVGTCSVCTGGGDGIPTLRMVELSAGAMPNGGVPLVEGIDSMRVEYSIDNDANGTVDSIKRCKAGVDACSLADWTNVMAVKVHLLARNLGKTIDYSDAKTYNMGLAGTIAAPGDGYKRHLYSALVIAHNQTGPRE